MAAQDDFVIVGGGSARGGARAVAALDLPLEIREVGDAGMERALENLVAIS